MALSEEDRERYQGYLTDAEAAYHSVRIGGNARVYVDQNGERVEYTATNAAGLRAYILELKALLGLPSGITGPLNAWML